MSFDDNDTRPITDLLLELRAGDRSALDRLFPLVYEELQRVAHRQLRAEREEHTLGTTGLVHEAYLRGAGQSRSCSSGAERPRPAVTRRLAPTSLSD